LKHISFSKEKGLGDEVGKRRGKGMRIEYI